MVPERVIQIGTCDFLRDLNFYDLKNAPGTEQTALH
jgi:hypothetical protein